MPRPIQLTEGIKNIVLLHHERKHAPEHLLPFFDYYIGETTGLYAHLTYSGAVYYGRKALKETICHS